MRHLREQKREERETFGRGGSELCKIQQKAARVSIKWFRAADAYSVEVAPGQNGNVIFGKHWYVIMMG